MSDDPLAGLRAWQQEVDTHLGDIDRWIRQQQTPSFLRHLLPKDETESALLDHIQRMGKTIATMQEQLAKVAMERDAKASTLRVMLDERDGLLGTLATTIHDRDAAVKKVSDWEGACGYSKSSEAPRCATCKFWDKEKASPVFGPGTRGKCGWLVFGSKGDGLYTFGDFGCVGWGAK
jgi:hypothetical protein